MASLTYEKTITHNLFSASAATGVVTQFWGDGQKLLPLKIETYSGDQLIATFTKSPSATSDIIAVVRMSDYTHEQTTALATWDINHNLSSDALITQVYSGKEEILPLNIENGYNDSTITFSEAVTGSAEFIWVEKDFVVTDTEEDPSGLSLSVSGSYWKVGIGTSLNFNPADANDVETMITSGGLLSYYESDIDTDIVIIEFNVDDNIDINITEIGIFNDVGRMMFYTNCSPLFKPSNAVLKLFYKITKYQET